jgi:tetratricopeptide (TPR) repeat protein
VISAREPAVEHAVKRDRTTTGSRRAPEPATQEAETLLRTGRPHDARAGLEGTVADAVKRRDRPVLRRATLLLGAAELALGQLDAAGDSLGKAFEMGAQDGDRLTVADATYHLGTIARVQGRYDEALESFQVAVPTYQRLGEPEGLSRTFHGMAATFRDLGELARAEEYERWAADYADEAGSATLQTFTLLGRAELALRTGDAATAESTARAVAATFERLDDPIARADALRVAGAACTALGQHDAAREALGTALTLAQRFGSALGEAETLRGLAELAAAEGDFAEMRRRAEGAFAVFARLGAQEEARRLVVWVTERAGRA